MTSANIRANAREALKGKWGKGAILTLVYVLVCFAISFVLNLIPFIGGVASIIISLPLSYGFIACFIKLKRGEDFTYTDFLQIGFSSFSKVWAVFGNIVTKLIIPIAIFIVFVVILAFGAAATTTSGILGGSAEATVGFSFVTIIGLIGYIASLIYITIKGYLYSLSYYLLYDNETMSGKEIVEESARLMNGNRWSFFWLSLTFIGWAILSAFTLYIGCLWLIPYIMVSFVCFYESLKGSTTSTQKAVEETTDNPIKTEE